MNRANVRFMRMGNHRKYPRNMKIECKIECVQMRRQKRIHPVQAISNDLLKAVMTFHLLTFGKVGLFAAGTLKIGCHVSRLKIDCLRMCVWRTNLVYLYTVLLVQYAAEAPAPAYGVWIWWVTALFVWGTSTCDSLNQWSVCRHQSL